MQRFYAFATGQNHANLPPILSLAKPDDTVVWLETPTARTAGWATNSNAVLNARGLNFEALPINEEVVFAPNLLRDALLEDVGKHPKHRPSFVITGGQKHSVLGFDRAAQQCNAPLLYSDIAPAQLRILKHDGDKFETAPLRNCLNLGICQ